MSDFRAVLDEEVASAVDDSIKKNHVKNKSFQFKFSVGEFFSLKSFVKITLLWCVVLGSLLGWVFINSDSTHEGFVDRLASKTVPIDRNTEQETFHISAPQDYQNMGVKDVEQIDQVIDSISADQGVDHAEEATVSKRTTGELTPAPVPGLYESLQEGLIPKARLDDGMTPFKAYKKPFTSTSRKPKISFVAVNLGLSRIETEKIIKELPGEVTLGFSPYAPDVKLLSDAARTAGHETWMMLPLQNESYPRHDPGPGTLLTTASIEQNQARLLSVMGRAVGYVGLITWENHVYTPKDSETSSAIQQIFGRGLGIIDSAVGSTRDFGRRIAYNNEFPFAKNNFWLDQNLRKDHMQKQLKRLEDYASARGEAVLMFRPYPSSIAALQDWLSSPVASEFELVPASYVAEFRDE